MSRTVYVDPCHRGLIIIKVILAAWRNKDQAPRSPDEHLGQLKIVIFALIDLYSQMSAWWWHEAVSQGYFHYFVFKTRHINEWHYFTWHGANTQWNYVNNLRNRPYLRASSLLISSRVTANVLPGDVISPRQLDSRAWRIFFSLDWPPLFCSWLACPRH